MTTSLADQPKWESVKAPGSNSVVYWRLMYRGRAVGAISRLTDTGQKAANDAGTTTWRALGYSPIDCPPNGNTELGRHDNRRSAESAVVMHWRLAHANPPADLA